MQDPGETYLPFQQEDVTFWRNVSDGDTFFAQKQVTLRLPWKLGGIRLQLQLDSSNWPKHNWYVGCSVLLLQVLEELSREGLMSQSMITVSFSVLPTQPGRSEQQ